jgi:hypothetical protein
VSSGERVVEVKSQVHFWYIITISDDHGSESTLVIDDIVVNCTFAMNFESG